MGKVKKYFNLLFLLLIGLAFTACSEESKETDDDSKPEVKFISQEVITAEELCNRVFGPEGSNSDEEDAELREQFMTKIHEKEEALAAKLGVNGLSMGFAQCRYSYKSTDQHGNPIWLSAMVSWAKYWFFGWHDLDPDNLYLVEHYTILSDDECPTNSCEKEQIALGDNLLIMPDYIGYGATSDQLHPYLNHEVCAINSIDALAAGYEIFDRFKEDGTAMEDDWKMYVVGCSQGGGNALAVHKYLDTHPEFAYKWRFDYSYCCAGPYCPRKTLEYYYENKNLTYPVSLPLVLKSMIDSYPEILGKWTEEDFYSENYLKVKPQIDKLISEKKSTADEINEQMEKLLGSDDLKMDDIFNDSALDRKSEMMQAFFKCLDKNDLTTGWTPSHMIKLYHSSSDDIVAYSNAEAVVNAFPGKVSLFNSYAAGHVFTCKKWYGTLLTNNW